MKYLLLCALLLCGAFLFQPANAQVDGEGGRLGEHNPEMCPLGGNYSSVLGFCFVPATQAETRSYKCNDYLGKTGLTISLKPDEHPIQVCLTKTLPLYESEFRSVGSRCNVDVFISSNQIVSSWQQLNSGSCMGQTYYISWNPSPNFISADEIYQCPPESSNPNFYVFSSGPYETTEGYNICYYRAEPQPECDCANFAGDSLSTFNDLRAPVGQYTKENPPQCIQQREYAVGRDEPLTCVCQVSAQKWTSSYGGFVNGVEYEVWSTLPTTQGQPSGTFTGVKCGDKDGGPLEPEEDAPKDCFTLKNGVKWCWADPKEHCQVVNGQEQCSSGCGYVNGDFVCYEETPVIPPREDQEPNPIDDTITDPNKSINDMIKGDFKDISRGTEQRLDNIAIAINNNQNSTDKVADAVGITNSKLDGIGMQLDGTGKDIGAIKGILEGALTGEEGGGTPDTGAGDCTENCSWYESAYPDGLVGIWQERSAALQQTPMFEFVNQFSFQPSGSQPDMELCLNVASWANFGCHSLEIPSFVWVFLKICILFTAAMLCRALIFGG